MTYEWECVSCGKTAESHESITEYPPIGTVRDCPACRAMTLTRIISRTKLAFTDRGSRLFGDGPRPLASLPLKQDGTYQMAGSMSELNEIKAGRDNAGEPLREM